MSFGSLGFLEKICSYTNIVIKNYVVSGYWIFCIINFRILHKLLIYKLKKGKNFCGTIKNMFLSDLVSQSKNNLKVLK